MAESTTLDIIIDLKNNIGGKIADVSAEMDRLGRGASEVKSAFSGIGNKFSLEFGLIKKAAMVSVAGVVALTAATVTLGVRSLKAYAESEKKMAVFTSTMKTMGKEGEKAKDALLKTANAATKLGFDDEQAAVSLSKFYQVTKSVTEAQKLHTLSMDLARAKNIDYETSAQKIQLVLAGNARALKEYNIELKDGQDPLKALAQLQGMVGGQTEAFTRTWAGQMEIFSMTVENLEESIGGGLATAFQPLLEWFRQIAQSEATTQFIQQFADFLSSRLTPAVQSAQRRMKDWYDSIGGNEGLIQIFRNLWDKVTNEIIPMLITLYETVKSVSKWFADNWSWIWKVIAAYEILKGATAILGVINALVRLIPLLWGAAAAHMALWGPIGLVIAAVGLLAAGVYMIIKHWDTLKKAWENSPTWFKIVADGFKALLGPIGGVADALLRAYDAYKKLKDKAGGGSAKSILSDELFVKGYSTGGVVYAATGGMIPRGTDTVPAMLTPGEMVLNAKQQDNLFRQLNGAGAGISINITGDNYFSNEADEDRLVEKIRAEFSREQERSAWGIA